MTRRFLIVFLFSGILVPTVLFAQTLNLDIPLGELPSDISLWSLNPKLMQITLVAPDGIKLAKAHLVFEVTSGSESIIVSTMAKYVWQPTISGSFKTKIFHYEDIVSDSAITVDPSIKTADTIIGKLPGSTYGICFYLVDSSGKQLENISQACSSFSVRDIDSPVLLGPANETTMNPRTPLNFSWTPAYVAGQTIHYEVKLYPIYEGQTANQAMASSSAFYKSGDIFATTFVYPADAPKLSSLDKAIGFAWTVTQLDQDGKTIGKNYGRSIPSVFNILKTPKEGK